MSLAVRLRRLALVAIAMMAVVQLGVCTSSEDRADSYYKNGVALVKKGELAKASLEFRNALRLKSDFIDARFALARIQEESADFSNAVKSYATIAAQAPKNIPARVRLTYILLAGGQADDALKYANEAIALSDTDPSALVAKAAVELKLGNQAKAIALAQSALKIDPKFADGLMVMANERLLASDPAGALKYLNQASGAEDRNIPLQVLRLTALDKLGDQPEVEKLFDKLIKLFPDNPLFRQGLVKWYLSKGRTDDAEKVLANFAATDPKNDQAQFDLVSFVNSQKGPQAAIAALNKIIAARKEAGNADVFKFRLALGQFEFLAKDPDTAIKTLQALVADAPSIDDQNAARVQLARIFSTKKNWDEAEKLVDEVLTEDPTNVDALSVRASIHIINGKLEKAIEDLRQALNQAPENPRLHALMAEAYTRNGSVVLAQEQYAKALSLDHNAPEIGLPMAQFLLQYGKTDQALRTLEAVRQVAPTNRDVLTLLGQVMLSTQDWSGAQQIAEALRQLDKTKQDVTADKISAAAFNGLNEHAKSIDLLKSALATTDGQQTVLPDLIQTYVQAGRQPAAEAFLKSILADNPKNVQAQILLGSVYMTVNKKDLAEQAFKAAAADDDGVVGDTALAQFYLAIGNVGEAERVAKLGLQQNDKSVPLHLLLAAIYQQEENFEDAISQYELLYKQNPDSTLVANDLASLLSERRSDKASLDQAYELAQRFSNSNIPQYLDTLGWIHYLRGDYALALPLVKEAATKLPNVAILQYHLGMVLKMLDQNDLAAATLKNAISLTPPLIPSDLEKAKKALEEITAASAATADPKG